MASETTFKKIPVATLRKAFCKAARETPGICSSLEWDTVVGGFVDAGTQQLWRGFIVGFRTYERMAAAFGLALCEYDVSRFNLD